MAIVYRSDWEALRIDDSDPDRPDPSGGRGEEGEGKYARDKGHSTATE